MNGEFAGVLLLFASIFAVIWRLTITDDWRYHGHDLKRSRRQVGEVNWPARLVGLGVLLLVVIICLV